MAAFAMTASGPPLEQSTCLTEYGMHALRSAV
jgi:hypothetical protein